MKLALLAMLAAGLAIPSSAAADTPQGKLTGSATLGPPLSVTFTITATVTDGGTDFVGLENDMSGNCNGDSGTVDVSGVLTPSVVCAHFVANSGCCNTGSPKMRFAYQLPAGAYVVVRITDNSGSPDTFALGQVSSLAQAEAWVNKGRRGGGFAATPWTFGSLTSGGYTVTP